MITAKIIADSRDTLGLLRVTTFELEYPRYIHSEVMTHRVFSRNASSSRAIPIEKMIEQVKDNTVIPMWTCNKAGMQGDLVTNGRRISKANTAWVTALTDTINYVKRLSALGIHKQNVNRLLEPFQHIKVVLTGADFTNFFNLRDHEDAQPEIRALAREMLVEYAKSNPVKLHKGEWHLPYASEAFKSGELTLEEAKLVSASCCAQVSYRNSDTSLEKAKKVYERLVSSKPLHASPFEHQCTPHDYAIHGLCAGNLKGWYQLRSDIELSNL